MEEKKKRKKAIIKMMPFILIDAAATNDALRDYFVARHVAKNFLSPLRFSYVLVFIVRCNKIKTIVALLTLSKRIKFFDSYEEFREYIEDGWVNFILVGKKECKVNTFDIIERVMSSDSVPEDEEWVFDIYL